VRATRTEDGFCVHAKLAGNLPVQRETTKSRWKRMKKKNEKEKGKLQHTPK